MQGACGPASREALQGTWVNKNVWPAKTVMKPDGAIEDYKKPSDTKTLMAGKAGTVAEYCWVQVPAFDPELFPTKIDSAVGNFNYIIAYREK